MGLLHELNIKSLIIVTLYENIDIHTAEEKLNSICNTNKPLKIQISSIGYFPSEESVLFLNLKAIIEFLDIQ